MTLCKRLHIHSPSDSPHKQGKIGPKRKRTLAPSPAKQHNEERHDRFSSFRTPVSHQQQLQLHVSQFIESEIEKRSRGKTTKEVFAYFLQKFVRLNSDADKPLREFLLPTISQLSDQNP